MQWFVLSWALTFGFIPSMDTGLMDPYNIQNDMIIVSDNAISSKIFLQADMFNHLLIWCSVKTYMYPSDFPFFSPFRDDYSCGLALYSKGIELGIWHECDHGVETGIYSANWLAADTTEIYIKFSGRTK